MTRWMAHRGPDGDGLWSDRDVCLGHRRLSIIDLAAPAQPLSNEDESVWVTFNGEIFNYVELRAELEALGHVFATRTDTEVLVHGYEAWGDGFVERLNGQFAFALWDQKRRRLQLVRDRVGILPLFYTLQNDSLVFSSSLRSVASTLRQPPETDTDALNELITFWAPLAPRTLIRGIKELQPGTRLVITRNSMHCSRYWEWRYPSRGDERHGRSAVLADETRHLLEDATRLRLRADVEVGAYLSGGLDSAALCTLMAQNSRDFRAFSLSFVRAEYDESRFQRVVAQHLGLTTETVLIPETSIAERLVLSVQHAECPMVRSGPVPLGVLSESVRRTNCKVVLTGEGADEVFGGYDIFKEAKVRSFVSSNPASAKRPWILKSLYPYLELPSNRNPARLSQFATSFFTAELRDCAPSLAPLLASHATRWNAGQHSRQLFSEATLATLTERPIDALARQLPTDFERWNVLNRAQYLEAKVLLPGYILASQGDRMLMMNGVEGRFPYLDHRVIEFANALDPALRMPALREKALLKHAFRDVLPKSTLYRTKQPYRASGSTTVGNPAMVSLLDEYVNEDALERAGIFDRERAGRLVRKIRAQETLRFRDESTFITVLTSQIWHRDLIQGWSEYRFTAP